VIRTPRDGSCNVYHAMAGMLRLLCVNDVYRLTNLAVAANAFKRLTADAIPLARDRGTEEPVVLRTLAGDFLSPNPLSPVDSGMSFVRCFNALGISHYCLGNHEANIKIDQLEERFRECRGVVLNSNVPDFDRPKLPAYDIVIANGVRVGVIGLLSNERSVFLERKFKRFCISDPIETAGLLYEELTQKHHCHHVVALTHQSIEQDRELARKVDLCAIVGGHEHSPFDEIVNGTRIIKTGMNMEAIGVLDLTLTTSTAQVHYDLVPMVGNSIDEPDPAMTKLVQECMSLIEDLEKEIVYETKDGLALSATGTRFRQTGLGAVICDGIRAEFEADVAVLNGATMKASRDVSDGRLNLSNLKNALPFPTKMICVEMPGQTLQDALCYSRANGAWDEQKRGFLQVDSGVQVQNPTVSGEFGQQPNHLSPSNFDKIVSIRGKPFDASKVYRVALPRNLLKGFTEIKPLMQFGHDYAHELPGSDVYVPALELVTRYFATRVWARLGEFDDIDTNHDNWLSRSEVKDRVRKVLSSQPSEVLLDLLIDAVDSDHDGMVSKKEFDRLKRKL